MTTMRERLFADRTNAMKSVATARSNGEQANTFRLDTLRLIISELEKVEKNTLNAGEVMNDEQVLRFLSKEEKTRQATADLYAENGQTERAEGARAEAEILSAYLPQPLTESEATAIVTEAVASLGEGERTRADMGRVMKAIKPIIGTRFDGKALSEIVRAQLGL